MRLADAIEQWGRAHRESLAAHELEALATIWRTVRASRYADAEVSSLTKGDAKSIMALFLPSQRREVSDTLNNVRRWALRVRPATSAVEPAPAVIGGFSAAVAGEPNTPAVVVGRSTSARPVLEPVGETGEVIIGDGPSSGSVTVVAPLGDGDARRERQIVDQGPVEGWEPAVRARPSGDAPTWLVAAVILMAVVAATLWILVVRS